MIEFMSSWAGGIVISVMIATILEMILPEGKNKKYIKTVIGVYILFSIVSPIITKVTGKTLDINLINQLDSMLQNTTVQTSSIDTSQSIEKVYITNLKEDIKSKIMQKGYEVKDINITVDTKDEQNYGKINTIYLQISNKQNKANTITSINEVNIQITNTIVEEKNKIPDNIIKELKEYLNSVYDVDKEKIQIE